MFHLYQVICSQQKIRAMNREGGDGLRHFVQTMDPQHVHHALQGAAEGFYKLTATMDTNSLSKANQWATHDQQNPGFTNKAPGEYRQPGPGDVLYGQGICMVFMRSGAQQMDEKQAHQFMTLVNEGVSA